MDTAPATIEDEDGEADNNTGVGGTTRVATQGPPQQNPKESLPTLDATSSPSTTTNNVTTRMDGDHDPISNSSAGTQRPRRPSILKKESMEKHVQFDGEVVPPPDPTLENNNTSKDELTSFRPGCVAFGEKTTTIVINKKKKTNAWHTLIDITILVTVIGCLMYATRDFGKQSLQLQRQQLLQQERDEAAVDEKKDTSRNSFVASTLNQLADAVVTMAVNNKKARTEPCDIFLNRGTIPGTGISIFAGKNYTQGEKIVVGGGGGIGSSNSLLLPLDLIQSKEDPSSMFLPLHALLIKDHSERANVQGSLLLPVTGKPRNNKQTINEWKKLVWELHATRPIQEGEELFVSYDIHPRNSNYTTIRDRWLSIYGNIPSIQEYQWAERILRDTVSMTDRMQVVHQRRYAAIDTDYMYQLSKHVVSIVNPRVAALLPDYSYQLHDRNLTLPTYHTSIPTRSLLHHQVYGTCLDDLRVIIPESSLSSSTPSTSASPSSLMTKVVASRSFKKGDVLTITPVHIVSSSNAPNYCVGTSTRTTSTHNNGNNKDSLIWCPWADSSGFPISSCWAHESSTQGGVLFCPLTTATATLIQQASTTGTSSSTITTDCPAGAAGDASCTASAANVEFQWTTNQPKLMAMEELLALVHKGEHLVWQIVALVDIQAGQEVFVADTPKSMSGSPLIRKIPIELVSDQW